jgi:amidase
MNKELWRWSAVELTTAIRSRAISSREAVESCFSRIDAINPRINAIVDQLRN